MTNSIESAIGSLFHLTVRTAALAFGGGFGKVPADPPQLPEETRVKAGGVGFHVLTWPGKGDPIVLFHGINSNAWMWGRLAPMVGKGRPVIAITLPGHGLSDSSPDGYSIEAIARLLLSVVDVLAPGRLSLAGHSYGGKVAVALAFMLGPRLRALCLADPVPALGLNSVARAFPWLTSAMFAPERGPFPDKGSMKRSMRTILYLRRWGEIEQRVAHQSFHQKPDGSLQHRLPDNDFRGILFGALAEDTSHFLDGIHCPVQLIQPDLSVAFLPGEVARLRKRLPQLEVRHISGDHDFIMTNPVDSAREMLGFLARG